MPTATWERLPAARREAVIAAAEREFSVRGFSGGSMNAIARDAGVAKGSLFQYFQDKTDFYSYLSELASARIRADMESVINMLDWDANLFDSLRDLVLAWEVYFHSHPMELAMTVAVNLEPDESARGAVRKVANGHYTAVLRPLLEAARRRGHLREDADVEAFLALLLVLMPHIALAPHSPGLDPVLGLSSAHEAERIEAIDRLLAVLRAAFAPGETEAPLSG